MYRAAQALRTRGWRAVAGRRAPSHRTTVTTTKPTVLDLLRQQRGRPTGDAVRKSPIPAGTNLAEVAAAEEDELSYYEDQFYIDPAEQYDMDAITDRFNAYMDPERYTFTPEGYVVDKYGLDAAREHVSIGAEGVELSSVDEDDLGEEGVVKDPDAPVDNTLMGSLVSMINPALLRRRRRDQDTPFPAEYEDVEQMAREVARRPLPDPRELGEIDVDDVAHNLRKTMLLLRVMMVPVSAVPELPQPGTAKGPAPADAARAYHALKHVNTRALDVPALDRVDTMTRQRAYGDALARARDLAAAELRAAVLRGEEEPLEDVLREQVPLFLLDGRPVYRVNKRMMDAEGLESKGEVEIASRSKSRKAKGDDAAAGDGGDGSGRKGHAKGGFMDKLLGGGEEEEKEEEEEEEADPGGLAAAGGEEGERSLPALKTAAAAPAAAAAETGEEEEEEDASGYEHEVEMEDWSGRATVASDPLEPSDGEVPTTEAEFRAQVAEYDRSGYIPSRFLVLLARGVADGHVTDDFVLEVTHDLAGRAVRAAASARTRLGVTQGAMAESLLDTVSQLARGLRERARATALREQQLEFREQRIQQLIGAEGEGGEEEKEEDADVLLDPFLQRISDPHAFVAMPDDPDVGRDASGAFFSSMRDLRDLDQRELDEMLGIDTPANPFYGGVKIHEEGGQAAVEALEVARAHENVMRQLDLGTWPAQPRYRRVDALGRAFAVGRRKESTASVYLQPGNGEIRVNGKPLATAFDLHYLRHLASAPLQLTSTCGVFDVYANVKGGGMAGQAGALRLAISRALQDFDPRFRPILKQAKFLERDRRVKEEKKPGKPKARRSKQWVKR